MTVALAMNHAAKLMAEAGLSDAPWQSKVLAAHLLGKKPSQMILTGEFSFLPGIEELFFALVKRRINGEPLQHITGNWDFFGRTFLVSPKALIPRPETELLVEKLLRFHLPPEPLILDAGTGTGVIGITLALEIPDSTVIATDISHEAAILAAKNARLLKAENYHPVIGNLAYALNCSFDLIAANLPYIPTGDIACLPSVVKDYDPLLALNGGENGISLILELVRDARRLLKPGGLFALETGNDQESSVSSLFSVEYWTDLEAHKDLAGNHRFVVAVRRNHGI